MDCAQVNERLAAHALGALDPAEEAEVAAHLAGCADCQKTANEHARVVAALPAALEVAAPVRPSAVLKQRLMHALAAETPPPLLAFPTGVESVRELGSEEGLTEERRDNIAPLPIAGGLKRPFWSRLRILSAVAAAIVVALALFGSVQLSQARRNEQSLRSQVSSLVDQQEVVLDTVDSPKTIKERLTPVNSSSPSYGKLYTRPDTANVVIMTGKLPQPPPGLAYQVWLTSSGRTQWVGTLKLNADGFGLLVFDAGHIGPAYDACQVILQPEGSTTPTSGTAILRYQAQ